jgi:glutamate/tyrosine decarboxylase-like PLP-dependent enzyme
MYASSGIAGTKPGAPIAAAWAVLNHLGEDGYLHRTRATIQATEQLVAGVRAIDGLRVLGEPDAHLVAIAAQVGGELDVFALADALHERGWFLDRQTPPDNLHATVSFGNTPMIDALLVDLQECTVSVRAVQAADRGTDYATLE